MNQKKIYRDVRKRYSDRATDADIVIALAIENNILAKRYGHLQAENDNLNRLYDELMEKYKAVKRNDRECDTCPEYKDYHCEKWCTVIRQTIADMKEDWIPINWIEDWLSDRPNLERTATEMNIMLMITDWQAEQKRGKQWKF